MFVVQVYNDMAQEKREVKAPMRYSRFAANRALTKELTSHDPDIAAEAGQHSDD